MRDAVCEHARLAGAGAGDHENGAFRGQDGLALGRVQVREVLLWRAMAIESMVSVEAAPLGRVRGPLASLPALASLAPSTSKE